MERLEILGQPHKDTTKSTCTQSRPNILFITVDDMNYDSAGVTGCPVPNITPNIDRLACEGIRFVHAHVNIAVCQPSRSVLLTGRYPHRNGAVGFNPIALHIPTLTEQLHHAGYLNGIVGKESHLEPQHRFFWDTCIQTENDANGWGRDPEKYYEHTLAFFQEAKRVNKPFFLMANSHDPHRPFSGSTDEVNRFGRTLPASWHYSNEDVKVPGFLPDITDVRKEVAQYFTSVHRCDETVGKVLQALDDTGLAADTVVMFLSDNGMAFPFAKTNCYLASTRTPWIVRWPGKIKPNSVDSSHMISGIDFMPTILEITGVQPPIGLDGRSFLPLLMGAGQNDRNDVFTMFNITSANRHFPMRCVQNRQFGYIYNHWSDQQTVFRNESQAGLSFKAMRQAAADNAAINERVHHFEYRAKEELYDFEKDPDGLINLANDPAYIDQLAALRARLLQYMESSDDPLTLAFKNYIQF